MLDELLSGLLILFILLLLALLVRWIRGRKAKSHSSQGICVPQMTMSQLSIAIDNNVLLFPKESENKENEGHSLVLQPIIPRISEKLMDSEFSTMLKCKMVSYKSIHQTHFNHSSPKEAAGILVRRMKIESEMLNNSLPCSISSSFYVCIDPDYSRFISVLIAGSTGTPYEHGLFNFHIYLQNEYPFNVPMVTLLTTGGGKIRFNPNLYTNGKVCLSLLGTWEGQTSEKWNPPHSNILQILLSISSIVMNDRIIENEPGYSGEVDTHAGKEMNEGYCNVIRCGNIKYAMIDMLKAPPEEFADVVRVYFKTKREIILEDVRRWIETGKSEKDFYTGITYDHNSTWCEYLMHGIENSTFNEYSKFLKENWYELKVLLDSL